MIPMIADPYNLQATVLPITGHGHELPVTSDDAAVLTRGASVIACVVFYSQPSLDH